MGGRNDENHATASALIEEPKCGATMLRIRRNCDFCRHHLGNSGDYHSETLNKFGDSCCAPGRAVLELGPLRQPRFAGLGEAIPEPASAVFLHQNSDCILGE